ncbi:SDR family oxidoreductase [Streptomyces sp. TRM64462]|uniref:SDR family NAD(P)-dependent oxidoreductase n=1 Tax=Streptomyces sp. TRM64462 TaxID=2741726 RepID=UPI00158623FE|nr:SDR family NAD(P)-dependent oxidoreductase [Streptomyces sp. TRM64462]
MNALKPLAKPLAVVTGASSGIGLELARHFADHGFDLVVCAENRALGAAAEDLRHRGADVRQVRADLATYDGVEQLCLAVTATGRPVEAAVLNAGVSTRGLFLEADLADTARVIDLNIASTVHLARRLLPGMVDIGAGRLLITSSVAALVPGPYQAVYNASKAFLLSFAEALRDELRDTGVTVTALLPGLTDTDFFRRAGLEDTLLGSDPHKDSPVQVAAQGYAALMRGAGRVLAGSLRSRAGGVAARLLPHALTVPAYRRRARPLMAGGPPPGSGHPRGVPGLEERVRGS